MRVDVKIDEGCTEPRVVIYTDKITSEVSELLRKLSGDVPEIIAGFREGEASLLDPTDIVRAYASNGKVWAETAEGKFQLRLRLYELENRLNKKQFVRISNSEIINLKKVRRFDLSFTGTICVSMSNGTNSYVSRRFVSKIKQVLGM